MKIDRHTILAVGFILIVSFNFCLTFASDNMKFGTWKAGEFARAGIKRENLEFQLID